MVEVASPFGGHATVAVRTLSPPPGPELCRFATVSDSHIGGEGFGRLAITADSAGSASERCLAGALADAAAWGAGLIVHKGDVTELGLAAEWARAAVLFTAPGIPVEVVPGNHDRKVTAVDAGPTLASAGIGYTDGGVRSRDVPGLRLVLGDSSRRRAHRGHVAELTGAATEAVAGAAGAAVVVVHHHFQPFRRAVYWPPGTPGPEGHDFLDALGAANPATLVTTGHAHRCRSHLRGTVLVTETGSTRDYPGTWAGYAVHEGGIRQVVRRVAEPDALAWTEATRSAYGGAWGRWSPGRLEGRCFSHTWPRRRD